MTYAKWKGWYALCQNQELLTRISRKTREIRVWVLNLKDVLRKPSLRFYSRYSLIGDIRVESLSVQENLDDRSHISYTYKPKIFITEYAEKNRV